MRRKKTRAVLGGFPKEAVHDLGQRLHGFWERFRGCFKTKTRNGSGYARHYLSGVLRMKGERHFTGIGREAGVDGQNLQHFSGLPAGAGRVEGQVRTALGWGIAGGRERRGEGRRSQRWSRQAVQRADGQKRSHLYFVSNRKVPITHHKSCEKTFCRLLNTTTRLTFRSVC
jgi:hypothetical protein